MNLHWKDKLKAYLENPKIKIAFIAVGNPMRGDDGLGLVLTQELAKFLVNERFLLLEGGLAPENSISVLRSFVPNIVILVDAVFGLGKAGEIHWLYPEDIEGFSASSHSLPLSILAQYLKAEYQCEVFILAITAQNLEHREAFSNEVEKALTEVLSYIKQINWDVAGS